MTARERLLAALTGRPMDRPAWSPFLAYWWEAQPQARRQMGQLRYMQSIGADPLLRGFGMPWTMNLKNVSVTEQTRGNERLVTQQTPVGSLEYGYRYSPSGDTWFLAGHPVKGAEDLKVLQWIYEHTELAYSPELDEEVKSIGEEALLLPLVGCENKTCFQSLVEKYIGTVELTYLIADAPEEVETCLEVMRSVSDKTAEMCAQSKAEAFIFWEDSSTTNISPSMFAKYTAPEIRAWGDTLHRAGKYLVHHACGHIRDLLPLMADLPIDAIESISPPPTGNVDIGEAFRSIRQNLCLIGGIEPVFFQECTEEQLSDRVAHLLGVARGRRFILANSDSCPPGVAEGKLSAVSRMVAGG